MQIVYKLISDKLIQTHQLLNLQESDAKSFAYQDSGTKYDIETIKQSIFKDIEDFHDEGISDEDIAFIFNSVDKYAYLNSVEKYEFILKLKIFFAKKADNDVLLQIIDLMNCSQCINDFSKILLSVISIQPGIIKEYNQIKFPYAAINLMNRFPNEVFPSLICIFAKTLKKFNNELFNEIKKFMENSEDPYYYGLAIYRFAELAKKPIQMHKLIPALDLLFSRDVYKFYLKTVALLSSRENLPNDFLYSFKIIFSVINWQILNEDCIIFLDDEDIINSLSFINQFAIRGNIIPKLLIQETNIDFIKYLSVNGSMQVIVKSLSVLINLYCHQLFLEEDSIPFLIEKLEELLSNDLPFSIKGEILDIYNILAENISTSEIDLINIDLFIDFLCDFLGSEDFKSIQKVSNICLSMAYQSENFYIAFSKQIQELQELDTCDEHVYELFDRFLNNDC